MIWRKLGLAGPIQQKIKLPLGISNIVLGSTINNDSIISIVETEHIQGKNELRLIGITLMTNLYLHYIQTSFLIWQATN